MDALTAFGIVSVTVLLIGFALERRSHWFTLACAAGCAMTSAYAFIVRVWVIGVIAFVGYLFVMNRWVTRAQSEDGRP
jgi:chromate transport protein ChrA